MGHKEHYIDGVYYPSVTTILGASPKPWLDRWREKWGPLAIRKTAAAAAIGTSFHSAVEAMLANEHGHVHGIRVHNMLVPFAQWVNDSGFKQKEAELHVVSREYRYSGTFDATGHLSDHPRTLALFDWKTSAKIYGDMALQLSAYAQAYYEQTGTRIKRGIIVLVSKDKPDHKLVTAEYGLTPFLFDGFLKRLDEYNVSRIEVANEAK